MLITASAHLPVIICLPLHFFAYPYSKSWGVARRENDLPFCPRSIKMCLAAPNARNQRHLEPCLGLLELYSHFLSRAWCSLR